MNTENCSKVAVLVPRLPGGSVIFLPGSWFNTLRKNISVKQLCYGKVKKYQIKKHKSSCKTEYAGKSPHAQYDAQLRSVISEK